MVNIMKVNALIFHKLISEQHVQKVIIDPRSKELPLPDERADKLVEGVLKSYTSEANLAYAGFKEPARFPSQLQSYRLGNLPFYEFSKKACEDLKEEMEKATASTGGYLTMVSYTKNDCDFFMVILIKDKEGIGISKTMELEDVQTLNLDKLHFAARINFSKWEASEDEDRRNHISFLKGKSRSEEVVRYFKEFLNIDENLYQDPDRFTQQLINTVSDYCAENYEKEESGVVRRRIHEYAAEKCANEQPISIHEVANLLDPNEPEKFVHYLKDSDIELPGEFKPIERHLKKLLRYRVKGKKSDYTLSFEQSAVENEQIWLDTHGNIVISDVPDWIKDELPTK